MRKLIPSLVLAAGLLVPTQASAEIPSVFNDADSPPIACEVQGAGANEGQRWCTTPSGEDSSRVASFDNTPIDVSVVIPPEPAQGVDGDFPLLGLYHGYGGNKNSVGLRPGDATVQHWVDKGYAVFTMTDRGLGQSCGAPSSREDLPSYFNCDNGFIQLLDQRYEVRDAQTMMGLLADDGVIDPQRIGAGGGSYGGAMAIQLGALKNRIRNEDGSYSPWTSPDGLAMEISATAPEITWSNLSQALLPNGSRLDYATRDPYLRPGAERTGVEKQVLLNGLYAGGAPPNGYYQTEIGGPADITRWKTIFDTGGPYDTGENAELIREINSELSSFHSVNGIALNGADSVDPAPALLTNGWVDDLFPVDESVGYYNRVREAFPDNPISMFHYDKPGHPRGVGRSGDAAELLARQDEWMDFYVKGEGADPESGVAVKPMTCPSSQPSGATVEAPTWAELAPGEVRYSAPGDRTIAGGGGAVDQPGGLPGTDCGPVPSDPYPGAVTYEFGPAPTGGYTLLGSPTVLANFDLTGSNDQVAVRLVDLASPDADEGTLVARGVWRPAVGEPNARQVFQLHPNGWKVESGHVLSLQLMPADSPYSRRNPTSGGQDVVQNPVGVSNLELRLPVGESPGGEVKEPAPKLVPLGYELSGDYPATSVPRLRASASPRSRTVKRGRAAEYTLRVTNIGTAAAREGQVCVSLRRKVGAAKCVGLGELGPQNGETRAARIKIRTKKRARPKTYPLKFKLIAADARPVRVPAKLRIRK
ncbi:hypothetical protein HJD18_01285 [Thermoleophilia bacterium SCSIO 60948]|nr:hypothetical protein HJD18_01285 [Thermoleophilia bacterium SCSIO 60948]